MYKKTLRRPDGYAKIHDEYGMIIEADTKQCCHCGMHFVMQKGSGKIRGFCHKCHDYTCGKLNCCKCVPYEEQIDLIEKGQDIII